VQVLPVEPPKAGAKQRDYILTPNAETILGELLPQMTLGGGLQIFIGRENASSDLHQFGVVLATYGVEGAVTGLLGILGPRRMPYERSISSVRYMAGLMSDLMHDLYRAED